MNKRKLQIKCRAITQDTIHNLVGLCNVLRSKESNWECAGVDKKIDELIKHFDKKMQEIQKDLQK